jgi:hypothetical protein
MDKMRLVAKVKAGASGAAALPSSREARSGGSRRCAPAAAPRGMRLLRMQA